MFLDAPCPKVIIAAMKHYNQATWGGNCLAYISTSLFIIKGSQNRNLMEAGADRGHGEVCFFAFSL